MTKARKHANVRRPARAASAAQNAISLLEADHRQVEDAFEQFESARSGDRKQKLAGQICQALKIHTRIEEEIFYPAFLQATGDQDTHHEAEVEHDGAKKLIVEIEGSSPDDEYFDAKVKVLSEMIQHHVNEEEKRDGMFAKARRARMDLGGLGEQLAARKAELMGGAEPEDDPRPASEKRPPPRGASRGSSRSSPGGRVGIDRRP